MRDPRLAEFGVCQDGGDHARIGGGAPVVRHRRRLQREPESCGRERNEARREREAPQLRRERAPEILGRVKREECARAEDQHRRHEMGEAAESEEGHPSPPAGEGGAKRRMRGPRRKARDEALAARDPPPRPSPARPARGEGSATRLTSSSRPSRRPSSARVLRRRRFRC